MRRRFLLTLLASAVPASALALGLAVGTVPRSATAATTGDRPFKGHASGTILSFPDPDQGTPGVVEYTGQATHLGRFARTEYFFLDEFGRVYGWMVYTAANGDQLWLD